MERKNLLISWAIKSFKLWK